MTLRAAGRSSVLLAIICIGLNFTFWPARAPAQGNDGPAVESSDNNLVTIRTKEAPLADVLYMLSQAAGIRISFGADIGGTVTVTLPEVEVEDALEAIVRAAGYYCYKTEGDIYVVVKEPPPPTQASVPEEPPSPKPGTDTRSPGGKAGDGTDESLPSGQGTETLPARELGPSQTTTDTGEPAISEQPRPPVPEQQPPPKRFIVDAIPVNYVEAAKIAYMFGGTVAGSPSPLPMAFHSRPTIGSHSRPGGQPWGVRGGGGIAGSFGGIAPVSRRGQSLAESFGQLGGVLGGGGGGVLGGGGGALGGGGLGFGRGGGYGGLGGAGGGGFSALLPEDIDAVTAFLDDNSLIVKGTPEAIDQFREIVALLDKPATQVEVSVKFVSITTTFEEAFGIDWAIKNTRIEIFNQGFAPPQAVNSVVRFATGNLDTQLNALVKSSRATVINEPRVSVTNNMFASVSFSTQIPFFAAYVTYNQFGQRTVDFQPDWVPVDNYLDVMPRVNADDSVTLFLMPNISNVAGYVEGPNGERIPITTYQNVFTQLTVKDGETVVIGGLITKDDSTTKLHTPLLSRIPIIGKLFDSRSKNLNDTELLIFVTPRILREATVD